MPLAVKLNVALRKQIYQKIGSERVKLIVHKKVDIYRYNTKATNDPKLQIFMHICNMC